MDVIRARRSVRTFDGKPLTAEDTAKIIEYANKVENPYGLPIEWKLLNVKNDGVSSPVITGTDTFIAGKMKPAEHAEEAFGYAFEKIVLYAGSLGIGTTWIAGTMDRNAFDRAMNLEKDEVMPCVSPLGYPAAKMSFRETMMRKIARQENLFFLMPHMCVMDYSTIKYKGGKLIRSKTLGSGDDCCNFHVVKKE